MTTIRGRAPLRLGLGGGGTDVSPYSEDFGGRVLCVTIDRYAYATVSSIADGVEFVSPDRQCAGRAAHGSLDVLAGDFALHLAVYRRMIQHHNAGKDVSIRLATQVDAPPGSGLGSSSALVVAMVRAMADYLEVSLDQYELARTAWEIERIDLGMAGGWQDQYAASFGGFNYIESGPDRVIVNPLRIQPGVEAELEASLLLYFGGVSRDSATVIEQQQQNVRRGDVDALAATHAIRAEAERMKNALLVGDIDGFAASLEGGWLAKKQTSSVISNPAIERAYEVASSAGMVAGKVSGAGGGGFMMLMVDPDRRLDVKRALEGECGGIVTNTHVTHRGAESWTVTGGLR
ncbi:hypothetical protein [Curtobacterium luteum]|uniref:GHMP family kinase ATP-binding protein n=1 Tax=Curtobacterium luteum TaxID=33881 RepID=UPI00382DD752